MAKWYGAIGYTEAVDMGHGQWEDQITEHSYHGDLIRNIRKLQNSGEVNDDINLSNEISIVADEFAYQNFHSMRYVDFMGAKWKITSVEVQRPRLILSIGGVWNEDST